MVTTAAIRRVETTQSLCRRRSSKTTLAMHTQARRLPFRPVLPKGGRSPIAGPLRDHTPVQNRRCHRWSVVVPVVDLWICGRNHRRSKSHRSTRSRKQQQQKDRGAKRAPPTKEERRLCSRAPRSRMRLARPHPIFANAPDPPQGGDPTTVMTTPPPPPRRCIRAPPQPPRATRRTRRGGAEAWGRPSISRWARLWRCRLKPRCRGLTRWAADEIVTTPLVKVVAPWTQPLGCRRTHNGAAGNGGGGGRRGLTRWAACARR